MWRRKAFEAISPLGRGGAHGHGVVAYSPRPRTSRRRARTKASGALPHMDDVPTGATEVVIDIRQVRADRGEGLANAAGGRGAGRIAPWERIPWGDAAPGRGLLRVFRSGSPEAMSLAMLPMAQRRRERSTENAVAREGPRKKLGPRSPDDLDTVPGVMLRGLNPFGEQIGVGRRALLHP